jgi:hypothetical protein
MAIPYYMGGLLDEEIGSDPRSYFTGAAPIATASFRAPPRRISHPGTAPRFADTLTPERRAELRAMIVPKVDTFEELSVPTTPSTDIPDEEFARIIDREAGLAAIRKDPSGVAIKRTPGMDSFRDFREAADRGEFRGVMPVIKPEARESVLGPGVFAPGRPKFEGASYTPKFYSPWSEDRAPPEPYEKVSFAEYFDELYPGRREKMSEVVYPHGEESIAAALGGHTATYEPALGLYGDPDYEPLKYEYELYDSYGRPAVTGPTGELVPKGLAPLMYDYYEKRHDRGEDRLAAERDAEIAAYWDKVGAYTDRVRDYMKSAGLTEEEYAKLGTAAKPLKASYVESHPDYEELVRAAVPTLDEGFAFEDAKGRDAVRRATEPGFGLSPEGLAEIVREGKDPDYDALGKELGRGLLDTAMLGLGGGALGGVGVAGKKLWDATKLLTGKTPTTAVSKKAYKEAIEKTEAGKTGPGYELGAPVGKREGVFGPLKGVVSKDVDVVASKAMGSSSKGVPGVDKLAYEISKPTYTTILRDAARRLYGKSDDASVSRLRAQLEKEIGAGSTRPHDISTPDKLKTYMSAMLKRGGFETGKYGRPADDALRDAMTAHGKVLFGDAGSSVALGTGVGAGVGAAGGVIGKALLGGREEADIPLDVRSEVDDFSSISPSITPRAKWDVIDALVPAAGAVTDASFRPSGLARFGLGAGSLGAGLATYSEPLGIGSDIPVGTPAAHHGPVWPVTTEMPIDATGAPIAVDDFSSLLYATPLGEVPYTGTAIPVDPLAGVYT